MSSQSSLEDRIPSARYYMNKIFGRTVEHVRALERDGRSGNPLNPVRRVTIEPRSGGGHRVVVERSAVIEDPGHAAGRIERIGSSPTSEHSFAGGADALRFLGDILSGRPPAETASGGETGRFLEHALENTGAAGK